MIELFVYWRCEQSLAAAALVVAAQMQAGLRAAHPGLSTRLYRRADEGEPLATLMEIYAGIDIDPGLQRSITAAAARSLAAWVAGERHTEMFLAQ